MGFDLEILLKNLSVFGGVEDNRSTYNAVVDPNKVILLKGTSIFGGIEIKSY